LFLGANSSRPTGSFRQRPKTYKARKVGISDASRQRTQTKLLTDVDHYLTLREPCVASLRSDRHQIGLTDRHHRNAHTGRSFRNLWFRELNRLDRQEDPKTPRFQRVQPPVDCLPLRLTTQSRGLEATARAFPCCASWAGMLY